MANNNPNMIAVLDMIEKGANPKEVALNIAQSQYGIDVEQFKEMARSMGINV